MSRIEDSAPTDAPTITVTVMLFADLRRFLPRDTDGPLRYTVPGSATVADLLAAVGIEARADVTAAVDGELAGRDTPLRDGAEVMLLSPMEGGAAAGPAATGSGLDFLTSVEGEAAPSRRPRQTGGRWTW